jgi:hypothetical protein
MWVRDTLAGTSVTNRFQLGDPKAQQFLPIENGCRDRHGKGWEMVLTTKPRARTHSNCGVDKGKCFMGGIL